ncbi:MAG: TerC/Alx family metal homeostasis membrane protein [Baekduia sp.]
MSPLAVVEGAAPLAILIAIVIALLLVDLMVFARGRQPDFAESVRWSIGWFVLSLLVAIPMFWLDGREAAVEYTTVYLIERTLSLDNLFVFLLLFGYFAVPVADRTRLLFWGIVLALILRGVAIVAGVELLDRFHWLIYILGVMLIVLAWRMLRTDESHSTPGDSVVVRTLERVLPVTEEQENGRLFLRRGGTLMATPALLALVAMGMADVAFAIDSIPAAFAITDDSFVIWAANAFALMGLRALFVLVEGLIERFRYMDETLAVVLALVGVKLLIEHWVKVSPAASLGIVLLAFAVGIGASMRAERRDR